MCDSTCLIPLRPVNLENIYKGICRNKRGNEELRTTYHLIHNINITFPKTRCHVYRPLDNNPGSAYRNNSGTLQVSYADPKQSGVEHPQP